MLNQPALVWEQPAWRQVVVRWITDRLSENGILLTGGIEQPHIRPWSTVMKVPTDKGLYYFKANAPDLVREAAVTDFLTRFRPELIPELVAVDLDHGWLLMEDAGIPLRHFIRQEKSFNRWDSIMPLYTQLQKDIAPHISDLLAAGMPDRSLERLPGLFESLVSDRTAMMINEEESLTEAEYQRLLESAPQFRKWCAKVAALGIPETVHHDDFHDGNIFLKGDRVLFTDWGESAVTHPFLSLVVMLRGAGNSLETFSTSGEESGPDTPEIVDLRRLYLNQWLEYAPLPELERVAYIAERKLGYVNRAISWYEGLQTMPVELRPEYAIAVPAYLQEYLNS